MHYNCRKIYFVTFEAHRNCTVYSYVYHCWAYDAKEAKETAKAAWSKDHDAHPFHLYAKCSNMPMVKCLKVIGWKGNAYAGEDCIDKFICTDLRKWRVDGINQYGPNAGQHYKA